MFDKDFLGFKKVEKELSNSLEFDIFKSKKKRVVTNKGKTKHFQQPKPQYTKKNKPILTKHQQTETKKFLKETGSAFSGIISKIKNRKIIKLEKHTLKQQAKAQALAHKIKTLTVLQDSLTDIARYEKEALKLQQEIQEQSAQMQDKTNQEIEKEIPDQGCMNHAEKFNPNCDKCLEWAENIE